MNIHEQRPNGAGFWLLSLVLAGIGTAKAVSVHSSHRYYQDASGRPAFVISDDGCRLLRISEIRAI